MTLSDTDLEARLRRDLRARADAAPPAPSDLAERIRRRHRSLRRREFGVAGAVLAAVLVVGGVPVLSTTLTADPERGRTSRSTDGPELLAPGAGLHVAPTRGGLADDQAWLTVMARTPWWPDSTYRDPGMELGEPAPDSKRVAFADDVPTGRVALVVGESDGEIAHAWFVGPRGAEPAEMTRAGFPSMWGSDAAALLDGEDGADTLTLVVVAPPGLDVERVLLPVVDADGTLSRGTESLETDDGIAVVPVERRWSADATLSLAHTDRASDAIPVTVSERTELADLSSVEPADPRGLTRRSELDPWVAMFIGQQLRRYGLDPDRARPTLLARGVLGAHRSAALVGTTFPSGATGMWLATHDPRDPDNGSVQIELPFGPAGTDLLDRVVALGESGGLVVSAPEGVRADVLDAAGTVVESLPLADGAGIGALADPQAAASVRIVDGTGETVAEVPIEVLG